MGVDAGYTQDDVRAASRAITGWTRPTAFVFPYQDAGFEFVSQGHDKDAKQILDLVLPPNRGIEDGEDLIAHLAAHPSTAAHIAYKLCVRFVADDPPDTLVDQAAQTFLATAETCVR